MPTLDLSHGRRRTDRYLNWLLILLLLLALGPIPIYIYVLEVHSSALARIDARLSGIETYLYRVLERPAPSPSLTPTPRY